VHPIEEPRPALVMGSPRYLFARDRGRIVPVAMASVLRFEAEGDYVRVHSPEGVHLVHLSLGEMERRLDPCSFLRVHRSHLVHLGAVKEIRPHGDRRFVFLLRDGTEILSSRTGAQRLRALIR
jgi:two-component system LytT family response regulator